MSRIPDNKIRNDIYENLPCQAMYNESVRKIKTNDSLLLNNFPKNINTTTSTSSSSSCLEKKPKEMLYATPLRKSDRCKSGERSHFKITATPAGTNNSINNSGTGKNNIQNADKCEKLYNVEYKLINKDNELLRNTNSNISSSNSKHISSSYLNNGNGRNTSTTGGINSSSTTDGLRYSSMTSNNASSCLMPGLLRTSSDAASATVAAAAAVAVAGMVKSSNPINGGTTASLQDNRSLEDRRILNFLKDTSQAQKKLEMGKDCPNASFSCLAREEHFANLVQQNFSHDCPVNGSNVGSNKLTIQDEIEPSGQTLENSDSLIVKEQFEKDLNSEQEQLAADNLEVYMSKKQSPDKEVNEFVNDTKRQKKVAEYNHANGGQVSLQYSYLARNSNVYINREWVIKKIALCLEQRISGKKLSAIMSREGVVGKSELKPAPFLPRPPTQSSGIGMSGSTGAGAVLGSSYNGCLILGSNGSGKTSICQAIMNGNSGTKGILNRKLLACYFVNPQNPDCHSLSLFIRSIALQILSHSTLFNKEDMNNAQIPTQNTTEEEQHNKGSNEKLGSNNNENSPQASNPLLDEELLINELKKSAEIDEKEHSVENNPPVNKKSFTRQISAPLPEKKSPEGARTNGKLTHSTQRSKSAESSNKCDSGDATTAQNNMNSNLIGINSDSGETKLHHSEITSPKRDENSLNENKQKSSPSKKSRIPVAVSSRVQATSSATTTPTKSSGNDKILQGGGEGIADINSEKMKDEIEAAINEDCPTEMENKEKIEEKKVAATSDQELLDEEKVQDHSQKSPTNLNEGDATESKTEEIKLEDHKDKEPTEEQTENDKKSVDQPSLEKEQDIKEGPELERNKKPPSSDNQQEFPSEKQQSQNIPQPLPKSKSCRTIIANGYYEMMLSNPEILECLNVDNIEKNPDECFKKALLFPLLELTPPRNALLLLIDSIDENYINEGNLISTLRGHTSIQKSHNIAELLSNHVHLFPKWFFLVCTTKKQTKHITKMFTGFKKITLDDLRKSHVVKDVQEYIINRLNTDFKGTINLTKEIIESLHQLYIKSNGCILYLEKVLDGIKENFFSFREIKLIPCTLNGLYLYICQKSFNKKQYMKIRPILNILLASTGSVDKLFVFNCLRTHNYSIDMDEFEKRLDLMKNIIIYYDSNNYNISINPDAMKHNNSTSIKIKIFHNSFADWLVDVKFATKKFICDVNEGHIMISMYYTLVSETLCANGVRRFVYHLIKSGEYLTSKNVNLDLILMLLESRINLNDCFYTNYLNCCSTCENEYKNDPNFSTKTRDMIEKFLNNELNDEFTTFLFDFFKPNLPTDAKILKLLIETGINNADSQASCNSSLLSPGLSEKSNNIDFELADLLISSEKTCHQQIQQPKSPSDRSETQQAESQDENSSTLNQISNAHRNELHKGKALIHILANEGNHHLLERALNACKGPIDLEIEDYNGQTALNIAARNGHLEVVKLLLSFAQPLNDGTGRLKRVDVNHADRDGWTPLRSASWGGHTEVVKLLIAHTGCLIDLADKEGRTALRAAAWSGHEDILKILIEAGADVNSVDRQGRTSLIAASYMGHYDIVEILLENGANVNHLDLDGRSALCVAALCGSSGYSKVISTLLEHGANTDQLDNDGMSPLLVSSFEGNAEICELLLENGADPDLADFMGRTPLWAACTAGHANVVKLLLFWGCSIDCMDSEGRTVLSIAAAQGNVETVRQLLDRGLDETHRDNGGWTPLHYAAFEGFHEGCVQILEAGAKIDECDNEGKTPLHLAAQEGRQSCVQALLEIHSAFLDQKAHDGKTALRLACLEGHIDCIETLLKCGCDVNCKDADSRTTLYILALENKLDVVKYLLDVTDVDVNIPDSEGRTALHVSAWQGHVEMVKLLLTMGNADVNAMDLERRTPLHSCAWQGNHEVMGILLYFGAIPDHACKQGATALGISAQEGHEKCVSILLKYGANPYKSDHCGRTPIKLAAKSNRSSILKIFETYMKNESNVEAKLYPNVLRSPDTPIQISAITSQQLHQPNHLMPNSNNSQNILNASNSSHSSNFYENTMQSDNSSLQKRKSVISSQSTGSSNEIPLSFTQQLQRHTKFGHVRNNSFVHNSPAVDTKHSKGQGHHKHSQILPDLNEYQTNIVSNITPNEGDMFDMDCMSPLYATPPHSPSSELSSPGQLPPNYPFEDAEGNGGGGGGNSANAQTKSSSADNHFARDTHMRIILGKETNNPPTGKTKRSGIATNPAMRIIRSRFDSAAQLIRRTNNILNISSNSNQGSSSIGVKSGTFQWRKESQM